MKKWNQIQQYIKWFSEGAPNRLTLKVPERNNKRIFRTSQTTNDETGIRDTYSKLTLKAYCGIRITFPTKCIHIGQISGPFYFYLQHISKLSKICKLQIYLTFSMIIRRHGWSRAENSRVKPFLAPPWYHAT